MSQSQNKPLVLCAFPGVGKTQAVKQFKVIDLDMPGVAMDTYIALIQKHIEENEFKYVLVPSWPLLRQAMHDADIPFTLFYPETARKEEYMARYVNRGSARVLIDTLNDNWEKFILSCYEDRTNSHVVIRSEGFFLSDWIASMESGQNV